MSYPWICILVQQNFKPGDLPPKEYLAWHEWAEVQRKAGIKQARCRCGKWITPQEHPDHRQCVKITAKDMLKRLSDDQEAR